MESGFVYACGILWCRTREEDAAWELVRALKSSDQEIRDMARIALTEGGAESLSFLEMALSTNQITPEQAAPCLLDILATLPEPVDKVN